MKLANPSIVIGLGGTGQWVLTYLKKNLIDTYGKVPPTVKLLAFDTTAMYSEEGASNGVDNLPQVDSVQLDAWEYIQLGGNIRGVFEDIKNEGKYQHISSWLQAEEYLSSFDDDAYDISKGAGQRRPFGRMAVFYDLGTGSPKITGKLIQAINDVMTANQRQQPIGFYIIASVAGGTGSGMFIDMAHIARKMAEAANVASAIRGFIVLQNTFAPFDKVYNIEPNAFAAMRELNRFMLAFDHDYPIYYSDAQREPRSLYNSIYKSKLFDSCHLIDAVRPNLTLRNVPPIRGVFPAVAECMTAFLDPETRSTFFQFYKNIGNEIAKAQAETGKAVYSSVGTYTYILPVEDMIDRNTYKAAIELLRDHLLKIEQDPVDKTLRVSSTGNTETNQPPREEAKSFLQAEKSRMGLQNLHFNQQVAQFLESGRMKEQDSIAYVADAGTEMLNWVLPSVRDDVILSDVKRNIQAIFETSFVAEVPNSKVYRDGTPEAAGRIKTKIKQMRENMLGREDASGNRTQGDLQKGLPEFQKRNTTRFRKLLTEKVEDILNGTTDDPMRGKVGKLPYARDFAGWLVQAFDEFIVFMRAVVEERANRGELSLAREYVLTTKQMMDETRNLTGLLDRIKGTAVNTQNQYIAAENYLLELERQEVLYQSVLSTAEALKAVASEFKAQCDRWLDVLALGEAIGRKEQYREAGVYTKLLSLQEELRQKREEQAQVQVYKYLSGPGSAANPEDDYKYEDELYRRLISGEWPDILSRFSWEFEEMGDGLYLHFKYGDDNRVVERDRRNTATETYTRFLLEILHPYFYEMRNETIADRMEYLFTPQLTAKNLLDNSEAMISYNRYEQPFSEKRKYVCVNRGIQVRYFDELAKALRQTAPNYRDNRVIGLTNKHRCTVISLDDLLLIDALAPYQSAQSTYLHETDRDLLHIFPAEINAVNLEQKLSQAPLFKEDHIFRWCSWTIEIITGILSAHQNHWRVKDETDNMPDCIVARFRLLVKWIHNRAKLRRTSCGRVY